MKQVEAFETSRGHLCRTQAEVSKMEAEYRKADNSRELAKELQVALRQLGYHGFRARPVLEALLEDAVGAGRILDVLLRVRGRRRG